MWHLLSARLQVIIVGAATIVVVYGINALMTHLTEKHAGFWNYLSLAATIITTGLVIAAQFLWFKLVSWVPWLQTKTFPNLNGTWNGFMHSTYKVPGTGEAWPPILTTITIRQTLFSISVTMKSGESTSYSSRETLEADYANKRFRVWYSYSNEPKAAVRDRSAPHNGVAFLEIDWDDNQNRLVGRYYNDRGSSGDMNIERANRT
ncbi:hypothetical protein [Chthonobacter rhizosphaerae]|uniref:Cap15 family cyclic dinucleotide receptor domain-containing protein n=1 Tax=Chthonobacter rhizosphaerae TaxID=2735553 RepID=UPI0015EFACCD|nr:hypothetical protein [Chthonobacter rhizosphaerae]